MNIGRSLITLVIAGVVLAGCSSGGEESSSPTVSESVATSEVVAPPPVETEATEAAPIPAGPSNIVDSYDTATCDDWKVTSALNRDIVSTYFAVKLAPKLELPGGTEGVLRESITTACAAPAVPGTTTVREVSVRSIKLLKQYGN